MKNKNLPQAVLFAQGKKALGGEVGDHTDAEVRKKGLGRILRRAGGGALAATGVVLTLAYGFAKQDKVDAAQVRADKAGAVAAGALKPGKPAGGNEGPQTGTPDSAPAASEADVATSPDTPDPSGGEPAVGTTPEDAAATPDTQTVSTTTSAAETGATAQANQSGGLAPNPPQAGNGPETGGVATG